MQVKDVRITPGGMTETYDAASHYVREREVSLLIDGELVRGSMCDPREHWQSVDQWVSWRQYEALLGLGFSHDRIVALFRHEVWEAYPGARIDLTREAAHYAGFEQIVLRARYCPRTTTITVTVDDRRFPDLPERVGEVREQFNFDALEDEPTDWISWQLLLVPYGLTESAWFGALRECAQEVLDDGSVYELRLSVDQLEVAP
jgi:hypothetical protein